MYVKIGVVKTKVDECIKTRRSCRVFLDIPVEKKKIDKIIEAGRCAPSACNRQAHYFKITGPNERKQIVAAGGAQFISDAPAGILMCYDKRTDNPEYADNLLSGAVAIENMALMAWSLKIGSCIVANLPPKEWLIEKMQIPAPYNPIAFLVLGYPKYIPQKPTKAYGYSPIRKTFRKIAPVFVRKKLERKF